MRKHYCAMLGRASYVVVGHVLRYMGVAKEVIAEPEQVVEGAITTSEGDWRLRRVLSMVPAVAFYHYPVSFKLVRD